MLAMPELILYLAACTWHAAHEVYPICDGEHTSLAEKGGRYWENVWSLITVGGHQDFSLFLNLQEFRKGGLHVHLIL